MSIYNKGCKHHVKQILITLDQLINALLGGWADCTISARCYINSEKYWYAKLAVKFLDLIFKPWDKEHCKESYESEINRTQLPEDMR